MKDPVKDVDDLAAPPYVTASGDLFCNICGSPYDEDEEDDDPDFGGDMEFDYP